MTSPPVDVGAPLRRAVGEKTAKALSTNLGLETVGDLVYHFPRRYDERGQHTDMGSLTLGEQVTVFAQVRHAAYKGFRGSGHTRRGRTEVFELTIADDLGNTLSCAFFNQPWRAKDLTIGRWGLFAGRITEFRGKRQLNTPDYVLLDVGDDAAAGIEQFAGELIPIYPAAALVPSWTIARCLRVVLDVLEPPPDPLPSRVRAAEKLVDLRTALHDIHRPPSREALASARRRLKWDEAFAVQVTLVRRKRRAADWPARARPRRADALLAAFDAQLPYQLTEGQQAVGEEIAADLSTPHPMHRLLQGEVGSGKTVCAVRAMLQVVDAGGQAALLAPTEVLAAQHYRGVRDLLGPFGRAGELDGSPDGTRVTLLTGSQGAAARRTALAEAANGTAGLVIGTHALLYEGVEFRDLGLVVVDEQHRFGVQQRDALRAKADQPPHVLVMTATPIPRTVAMTVYGDLEVSTLAQLPQGRSPIASHVVPAGEKPHYLERAWERLREEVGKGHQAYVVCPRIGEAAAAGEDVEADEAERRPTIAVLDIAPLLTQGPLAGLRLGVLHGRLPADEKDAAMRAFAAGSLDVLVATTVVEVGVDVPNATMMMVLDADRFGVSQLHQLRGRVGRGTAPGLCLLVTETTAGSPARERLEAVASTVDGFRLAELDLEQRREGDVLGAVQSGRRSHLKLLSLLRDADLIQAARVAATELIDQDPELVRHEALRDAVAHFIDEERGEYLEKG